MEHFFLTLPSNSSEKYFPNNTATNFVTKLPKKIVLDDRYKWEVGLIEIILPQTRYNVNGDDVINVYCSNCVHTVPGLASTTDSTRLKSYNKQIKLQHGYYATIRKLVDHINVQIEKVFNESVDEWNDMQIGVNGIKVDREYWPKFQYSEIKRKTVITLHGKMSLSLSINVAEILGFGSQTTLDNHTTDDFVNYRSSSPANIEAGREVAYIYCDILEHSPVGDVMAPLLRIVDIDNDSNGKAIMRRTFDRPFYMPLRCHQMEAIEILIKGEFETTLPFILNGRTIVTLHFRQSKATYFH